MSKTKCRAKRAVYSINSTVAKKESLSVTRFPKPFHVSDGHTVCHMQKAMRGQMLGKYSGNPTFKRWQILFEGQIQFFFY